MCSSKTERSQTSSNLGICTEIQVEQAKRLSPCPAVDAMCEVTLGVIPVSLRSFAYDVHPRCHSLVWLRRDEDSSFIPFLTRRRLNPGLVPRPETPGFPTKIRLPSNTNTIPIPLPLGRQLAAFQFIQGNTVTPAHCDAPHMLKYGKARENPDSTNYMCRRCGSSKPTPTTSER